MPSEQLLISQRFNPNGALGRARPETLAPWREAPVPNPLLVSRRGRHLGRQEAAGALGAHTAGLAGQGRGEHRAVRGSNARGEKVRQLPPLAACPESTCSPGHERGSCRRSSSQGHLSAGEAAQGCLCCFLGAGGAILQTAAPPRFRPTFPLPSWEEPRAEPGFSAWKAGALPLGPAHPRAN